MSNELSQLNELNDLINDSKNTCPFELQKVLQIGEYAAQAYKLALINRANKVHQIHLENINK